MKKVITYGTYNLLHQGHINLLQRAKDLGDYLIVGVPNDSRIIFTGSQMGIHPYAMVLSCGVSKYAVHAIG